MSATASTTTLRPKEFHFPLSVRWTRERRVSAQVEGKQAIEITPPPVFPRHRPRHLESGDFFVAAAASCLAVTFIGLAERAGLGYTSLKVDADSVAGLRSDGRFGFTRLLLELRASTKAASSSLFAVGAAGIEPATPRV